RHSSRVPILPRFLRKGGIVPRRRKFLGSTGITRLNSLNADINFRPGRVGLYLLLRQSIFLLDPRSESLYLFSGLLSRYFSRIAEDSFFYIRLRDSHAAPTVPTSVATTRALAGALFLLLTCTAPAAAQSRPVPFTRTGAHIVIHVIVGGQTRHFLVDTGAGMTVLSVDAAGWSLADLRKGALQRSAVGIDGSSHPMGKSTATLEIARKLIVTPVGVTDLRSLSKALNVKLDGILGQDVLSQFGSVTVDYKNRQLIFEM